MSGRVMELVARAHLTWKRRLARDLQPHGVGPKQLYVLRQLAETGGLAPSRLAELLYADRPTTTSLLDTLQRAGWVRRRRHPHDGRQVVVEITAQGRRKLESVPLRLWRSGHTEHDPEAALSAAERRQLLRLLEKLNAALGEPGAAAEETE